MLCSVQASSVIISAHQPLPAATTEPPPTGLRAHLPRALVAIAAVALAHVIHARVTAGGVVTEEWKWPAQRVREREARLEEARSLVRAAPAAQPPPPSPQ